MNGHPEEKTMTNSHILAQEFEYYEAATIEEASELLTKAAGKMRVLAGGSDLIVALKMEREKTDAVLNISRIPGLNNIQRSAQDGSVSIGALVSIYDLGRNAMIRAEYPVLAEACSSFGSTQVEAMGTVGGNLCNGSPAADTPPALMALQAKFVLASAKGKRTVGVEDFFLAPGKTALQTGEILTEVVLPAAVSGSSSAFLKMTRVTADLAKVSLGLYITRKGETVTSAYVAMGAVAPRPIRLPKTEAVLTGRVMNDELVCEAAQVASEEITPIDDVRSTADYRRKVTKAMLHDGLEKVWKNAAASAQKTSAAGISKDHQPQATIKPVRADEMKEIEFTLNGKKVRVAVAPHELLLNVLRDKFELTGTKYACGIGECSACTIQVDGKPMLSCLILAVSVSGKQVTTVEGLQDAKTGALDKLQEAFVENTAFQCGYCTPGMLMTAKVLLTELPQPTEDQVRHYLRGNFCRCTGYASIVRAVLAAAEK